MSTIKLYTYQLSPSCRAVQLAIKGLEIDQVEYVEINLLKREHITNEFFKKNPLQTVPALEDENGTVWDSHAINIYLAENHARSDSLYPKNPHERAAINKLLFFNAGILQTALGGISRAIFKEGAKQVPKNKADAVVQAYMYLETLLNTHKSCYVAGEHLSLADFSIASTISQAILFVPLASNRFPKIQEWLEKIQSLPYYKEANQNGIDQFAILVKSILK